tara:strand:- start:4717 stop:4998 length:282 start_codon:yes stop_codon:yes gene_type:complete
MMPADDDLKAARSALDHHILQRLAQVGTECCLSLRHFETEHVTKEIARAVLRSLADHGLCYYSRGLTTDDGEFAGAGYGITDAGIARLNMAIV